MPQLFSRLAGRQALAWLKHRQWWLLNTILAPEPTALIWEAPGDSLTIGGGGVVPYVSVIAGAANPFTTIENQGIGGSNTKTWDDTFLATIPTNGNVYSVLLVNAWNLGLDAYFASLTSVLSRIAAFTNANPWNRGVPEILLIAPVMRGGDVAHLFDSRVLTTIAHRSYLLAEAQGIHFLDLYAFTKALCGNNETLWATDFTTGDGIHPDSDTQALMAVPILEKLVYMTQRRPRPPVNIAPPYTSYLPTVLLLHMNGPNGDVLMRDAVMQNFVDGTAPQSNTVPGPFSATSGDFSAGDIQVTPPSDLYKFGASPSGDWCIRGFIWTTTASGANKWVLTQKDNVSPNTTMTFILNSGLLKFVDSAVTGGVQIAGVAAVNDGAWHHFAAQKRGAVVEIFVDGAAGGTTPVVGPAHDTADNGFTFGATIGATNAFLGYLAEIEILQEAPYTGPFVPPVTPSLPA